MSATKVDTLPVPGAILHYQVSGSGPMLILIQGGDGDADANEDMAKLLTDRFTVVTYDRRGLSRSTIEDASTYRGLETHSDDVHRLLAALTKDPALVLGSSIGALIGLDLVARHPDQVHTFVAHEPPATELLDDAGRAQAQALQEQLEEGYREGGVLAAMMKFVTLAGMKFDDLEPGVVLRPPGPGRMLNMKFFLENDAPAVRHYRLDFPALERAAAKIIPAGSRTGHAAFPYACVVALAQRLGRDLVELPGGHNGFITHPRAFAARLREILEARLAR